MHCYLPRYFLSIEYLNLSTWNSLQSEHIIQVIFPSHLLHTYTTYMAQKNADLSVQIYLSHCLRLHMQKTQVYYLDLISGHNIVAISDFCQAQFQLASLMTTWTEISLKFDYYCVSSKSFSFPTH